MKRNENPLTAMDKIRIVCLMYASAKGPLHANLTRKGKTSKCNIQEAGFLNHEKGLICIQTQ